MKLFLDTDLNFPSDDFEALLLLLSDTRVELLGCGAAAGNTWAEEVAANLEHALSLIGREEIPVYDGQKFTSFLTSMVQACELREQKTRSFVGAFEKSVSPRPWVLGNSGNESRRGAAEAIVELARRYPGELIVMCTGPLTNLAAALEIDPSIALMLRRVYVMGGHFKSDGTSADNADFNVWFDPIAAVKVFDSGAQVLILPLNVCKSAAVDPEFVSQVCVNDNGAAGLFVDDFLGMVEQHGNRMPLWDQLLALVMLDSDVVTDSARGRVDVSLSGPLTAGLTVLHPCPAGSVELVRTVDRELVRTSLIRRVSGLWNISYRRPRVFATPRFLYHMQERLERSPLHFLELRNAGGTYMDLVPEIVRLAERFVERAEPLVKLLLMAKMRGELWPPAPLTDAAIKTATPINFEAEKEMERLFFRRFEQVDAIAVATGEDGVPHGFTCLSLLTPVRRREMNEQFGFEFPEFGYITEFGIVGQAFRGKRTFEHMNARLFTWCCECHPGKSEIPVFGVVLESQKACRSVIGRFGFEEVGQRVIPDGPEAGRVLGLFQYLLRRS